MVINYGLEVPCEYQFEGVNFPCYWFKQKFMKEEFNLQWWSDAWHQILLETFVSSILMICKNKQIIRSIIRLFSYLLCHITWNCMNYQVIDIMWQLNKIINTGQDNRKSPVGTSHNGDSKHLIEVKITVIEESNFFETENTT